LEPPKSAKQDAKSFSWRVKEATTHWVSAVPVARRASRAG
jgi:hypothetical protein